MNIGEQIIKEMETAEATALQKGDIRARAERIEAIKREQREQRAAGVPDIVGIDYAAIARQQAEDEEREEAKSRAVQKYLPLGMKSEEAFKLLHQLKEQGFEIYEYRHEGARNWPDGAFKPYLDEATRRNLQQQYPKGVSGFTAKKQYGIMIRFLATKHIAISFRVVDGSGVISKVKGDIGATGL